jgi:hypothetical protein
MCARVSWLEPAWQMPKLVYWVGGRQRNVHFYDVIIRPEPEYPAGRKGLAIAGAWTQLGRDADGLLILDGDVAIDPHVFSRMFDMIGSYPGDVLTAPAKIWPVSTHRESWVWSHWTEQASQEIEPEARWFSFCFTYLPRRLLDSAVRNGLRKWTYPRVDASMSKEAQRLGIPVQVVKDCSPLHLNW